MGLLFKLITLPVSGPIGATVWIAEQVQAAAEREMNDESTIRQQLAELQELYDSGQLGDEEYEQAADDLVDRLLAAKRAEAAAPADPADPYANGGPHRA